MDFTDGENPLRHETDPETGLPFIFTHYSLILKRPANKKATIRIFLKSIS